MPISVFGVEGREGGTVASPRVVARLHDAGPPGRFRWPFDAGSGSVHGRGDGERGTDDDSADRRSLRGGTPEGIGSTAGRCAVRLLVTGIAVMDCVHWMDALPAGGTKYRSHAFARLGGGLAGNAAVGAARLGAQVTLMTRLGTDAAGDDLAAMFETQGLRLVAARGGRTPISSVMVAEDGERMIVNFPGADLPEAPPPLPPFDAALTDCRWPAAAEATLRDARARGVPCVIDGDRFTPEPLAMLASHVVFSLAGLRDFTGIDDPARALAEAAGRLPGCIGYTAGAGGVHWADGLHVPAPAVVPVDTLGAGDLWHGAFAAALGFGRDVAEASRFANRAAALKCERTGGWDVYPTAADLDAELP